MQASLLMTRELVTCRPDASLAEAAHLMRENHVGFLPVLGRHNKLAGVLTDRDALMATVSAGKAPAALRVRDAMTQSITCCGPDADLALVERLLAGARLHRLPVTDEEGTLLGVISIDDLARAAARKGDPEFQRSVALTLGEVVKRKSVADDED